MPKRSPNRFIGSYQETVVPPITLPYTITNFRALLAEGTRPDSRYMHQQIKNWASRFWWELYERPTFGGANVPADIEAAAQLAQEIEMQWDMYLVNTYPLDELQRMDFSQVHLPCTWFTDWMTQLDQGLPPIVTE